MNGSVDEEQLTRSLFSLILDSECHTQNQFAALGAQWDPNAAKCDLVEWAEKSFFQKFLNAWWPRVITVWCWHGSRDYHCVVADAPAFLCVDEVYFPNDTSGWIVYGEKRKVIFHC